MVSCYEQKENKVYCAYVTAHYPLVTKLNLQLIEVNPSSNTLTLNGNQVIKTFYTEFNFLRAVPFDEDEAIILFRVGTAKRYEKLNIADDWCRFRKGEEDDSIDIGVLSKNYIYVACESENDRLRGFIIYPGKVEIDEFNFNNFDAKEMKNPAFAKFDKSMGIFYTHINSNNKHNVNFHLMNYPLSRL